MISPQSEREIPEKGKAHRGQLCRACAKRADVVTEAFPSRFLMGSNFGL